MIADLGDDPSPVTGPTPEKLGYRSFRQFCKAAATGGAVDHRMRGLDHVEAEPAVRVLGGIAQPR